MIGLGSDKRNVLRWEFFFFLKTSINRIGIKSFKIGLGDFASICLYWPKTAKKVLKLTFKGLKCPQQVRVEHKICSTMCGKSVHPILDHKNLTGGRGVNISKYTLFSTLKGGRELGNGWSK